MAVQSALCGTALHYSAQQGQDTKLAQLIAKVTIAWHIHEGLLVQSWLAFSMTRTQLQMLVVSLISMYQQLKATKDLLGPAIAVMLCLKSSMYVIDGQPSQHSAVRHFKPCTTIAVVPPCNGHHSMQLPCRDGP